MSVLVYRTLLFNSTKNIGGKYTVWYNAFPAYADCCRCISSQYSKGAFLKKRPQMPLYLSARNQTTFRDSSVFGYLSDCAPTEVMRSAAVYIHDFSGLPWWATVVMITATLRIFLTFPLSIYQTYILAKVENLSKLDMPEIARDVKQKIASKARVEQWSEQRASLQYKIEMKKKWNEFIVKHNCHPFKATVTLWVQLPTWVFFSAALRNLVYMLPYGDAAAQIAFLQLSVGGLLWLPNLTQPDGLLILPFLLGLSNLAIIEMQVLRRVSEPSKFQRYATNFFRTFSICLIPISMTIPSVVSLYWTTSSLLGLTQNFILMSNRFRAFCRIPDTPTTFQHPYRQLLEDIKIKTLKWKTS